jgi:hypothetical protein
MKLGSLDENAYAAGHLNIKYSGAQNIHSPTSSNTVLLQEMEIESHNSAPLIVINQKNI